jgi:hypothetical protein
VPLAKGRAHVVGVERRDGVVSVDVDGNPALDRVSAPALRRDGLRICTWGADPAIACIEVRRR